MIQYHLIYVDDRKICEIARSSKCKFCDFSANKLLCILVRLRLSPRAYVEEKRVCVVRIFAFVSRESRFTRSSNNAYLPGCICLSHNNTYLYLDLEGRRYIQNILYDWYPEIMHYTRDRYYNDCRVDNRSSVMWDRDLYYRIINWRNSILKILGFFFDLRKVHNVV